MYLKRWSHTFFAWCGGRLCDHLETAYFQLVFYFNAIPMLKIALSCRCSGLNNFDNIQQKLETGVTFI